jgi:hypothetical protein
MCLGRPQNTLSEYGGESFGKHIMFLATFVGDDGVSGTAKLRFVASRSGSDQG